MKTISDNVVVLDRGYYTTCAINFHGATIVSWRIRNLEQLFVSREAVFDNKQPTRGGVTLVFPHFSDWNFGPKCGFARIMRWKLEKGPERLSNGDVEVVLSLTDDDFTRSMWNYPFRLMYRVTLLERELHLNITLDNLSKKLPFTFNFVVSTFFKLPNIEKCEILGLKGSTLVDTSTDEEDQEIEDDKLCIREFTNNFYRNTPNELEIQHTIDNKTLHIEKNNLPDTIIWNPWTTDFGPNEYKKMVCFKTGNIAVQRNLLAGETFEASEVIKVIKQFDEKYINLY